MRLEGFGHSSRQRWLLIIAAVVCIWLSFAWTSPRAVVSAWNDDGSVQAAPPKGQAVALNGLFAKSSSTSTSLASAPHDPDMPWGNPTDSTAAVMTQGYGIGTHAPAATWGAIDIAIDSNGDGRADPRASDGAPIYATHRGVVTVTPNSVPAGNHIWVRGEHYRTGYSHLKRFAVQTGQVVERGTLIGYMGATGRASGPHLDYQVWKDGVNQNPLSYGAMPK